MRSERIGDLPRSTAHDDAEVDRHGRRPRHPTTHEEKHANDDMSMRIDNSRYSAGCAESYAACGAISTMRSAARAAEIRSSEWDGGDDAAGFKAGERGLGHSGSSGEFGLRQAEREAAFADCLADQVGALGGLLDPSHLFGAAVAASCLRFGYNGTSGGQVAAAGNGTLASQEG